MALYTSFEAFERRQPSFMLHLGMQEGKHRPLLPTFRPQHPI